MAQCMMCGRQISMFNQIKLANGCLCKVCSEKIPSVMKPKIGGYSLLTIETILRYGENPLFQKFQETANYGKLHIDEMHGLFLISDSPDKITEKDKTSIFYVLDLSNVGLYCTNPRVFRGSVAVDIKFDCEFEPLGFRFSLDIKQQVFCASKKIKGGSQLEWDEPGDFSMFRNIFNQMIRNESDKFNKRYQSIFMTKAELDVFKARCLFMFDDGEQFSKVDLKTRRNSLMKTFHSDVSSNSTLCAQRINEAYKVLLPLAERL